MHGVAIAEPALSILLPGRVPMTFKRIEPGEFRMGRRGEYPREEPVHLVRISQPFYLGTYPTEYYTGDGEAALMEAGWFGADSTGPVGTMQPNAFGLFDRNGNVWEWCHDVYDERAYCWRVDGFHDPGWEIRAVDYNADEGFERSGNNLHRILRGGSWSYAAGDCRSAFRVGSRPAIRLGNIGFRVCLVPGPVREQTEGGRGKRSRRLETVGERRAQRDSQPEAARRGERSEANEPAAGRCRRSKRWSAPFGKWKAFPA